MNCQKVQVICKIYSQSGEQIARGVNTDPTGTCQKLGCLKIRKYGDDSSEHRNPADCNAIHAEIVALLKLASVVHGHKYNTLSIWITRYPCEACIRAIIYFSRLYNVRFLLGYNDTDGKMSEQSQEMWDKYCGEVF